MDFFQAEERARRHTGWLVALFILAVCGTVLGVYVAARLALNLISPQALESYSLHFWDPNLFWRIAGSTLLLIIGASFYKTRTVTSSADAIAVALGGRPVDPNTHDPYERRLLNVVEEMAIASGIPVPAVHVLPAEPGINAL